MSEQTLSAESQQLVSFFLHDGQTKKKESYAITINDVKEIKKVEKITPIPNVREYVLGIINLRDAIVPVIDVRQKLGFTSEEFNKNSSQRILITEKDQKMIGLLVDEVDEVVSINVHDIEPTPDAIFDSHNFIQGIAKLNDKLMIILDVQQLVSGAIDNSIGDDIHA